MIVEEDSTRMPADIILHTERFILREFSVEDAPDFYLLNQDEEVLRYTGDNAFESVESASVFLRTYDQYNKNGFGRWAVIDRITGEYTGWCGLRKPEGTKNVDLGYRFFRKFWNKGYATETSLACIKYGFEKLNMTRIIARAMKENLASVRVMEKIGMKYLSDYDCGGKPGVIYAIDKVDHKDQNYIRAK